MSNDRATTSSIATAALADDSVDELRTAIAVWLKRYLIEVLGPAAAALDDRAAFDRYGLDSAAAIAMSSDLGQWLGCEIDAAVAYEHPSIARLSRALATDATVRAAAARRGVTAGGAA
jgi:acyl carrier protein